MNRASSSITGRENTQANALAGIHQPHYLPWLRYFDKIARCDLFILLDTAQYNKNGWQNRNRIKTPQGTALLTAPIHAALGTPLQHVPLDPRPHWRRKHWRSIEQNYRKAPYFNHYAPFLEETYARPWNSLCALCGHMLQYFLNVLEISTPVRWASSLAVEGAATERLINLMKAAGCDRYYSGAYALETYLDAALLRKAGITLEIQQWTPPIYPQLYGPFVPDLSIIDLLMNCGPRSRAILLGEAP